MSGEIYCKACDAYKKPSDFSDWYEQGCKKARRCNPCFASAKKPNANFKDKMIAQQAMTEERQSKLTPAQLNYADSDHAKKKLSAMRSIEDIKLAREIGVNVEDIC